MFRRRRHANDFAEEIQAHLELEADELKDEGLNEEEAHRRAKIAFGNVGAAREQFRLRHRVLWLDNLIRDFRFALRQMARNPGFAATAILVLGLGMGVSVAIFAFVDAALLEPLPYANPSRLMSLVLRAKQDPGALLPSVVRTLHQIDANISVSDEETMNAQIDATQAALLHRFSAWLIGGFAVAALLLGVVGLYGVIAYSVSQRTREIGVRIALGAQRSAVYALILRQAGWLTVIGLAIGLVCSIGTARLMRSMLFGVQTWDAMTLGCVAGLLAFASLAAAFLPARRAASVDPVEALRAE